MALFKLNLLKNANLQKMMLLVVCVVLVGYIVFSLVKRNNKEEFYFKTGTTLTEVINGIKQNFAISPPNRGRGVGLIAPTNQFNLLAQSNVSGYNFEVYYDCTAENIETIKESLKPNEYMTKEPMAARTHEVSWGGTTLLPLITYIGTGDTVTWTIDKGHNVVSGTRTDQNTGSEFDSGDPNEDLDFSNTFNTAGEFPYHCESQTGMDGEVRVQDRFFVIVFTKGSEEDNDYLNNDDVKCEEIEKKDKKKASMPRT